VAAVTPTSILAESATTCFGFTARLALERMQDGIDSTPSHVRGVSWVLEIDGSVDASTANEVVASVDSFAIRGDQGNRLDLAIIKLPGFGRRFSASGLVRIPELPGGVQEGDQTRILAWIQTPGGSFGVQGIIFNVRQGPAGPESVEPGPLASEGCPNP
jgi:hypothetical protein